MNFQQYLGTVKLRCRPFDNALQIRHGQLGMLTEIGELGDLIKRAFVYGKQFDPINLLEECGDYLWYFVLFCDEIGIHMRYLDDMCTRALADMKADEVDKAEELGVVLALGSLTGALCAWDKGEPWPAESLGYALGIVLVLLHKHGFTLEQCLIKNDAKLEQRTGKVFDPAAILNRDVGAERAILES